MSIKFDSSSGCNQCMFPSIQDDQPRAFPLHSSARSTGSVDSPTSLKKREPGIALAATFTANNRWAASTCTDTYTDSSPCRAGTSPTSAMWLLAPRHSGFLPSSHVSYLLITAADTAFRNSAHTLRGFLTRKLWHKKICVGRVWEEDKVSVTVVLWRGWSENTGCGILNTSHKLIINTWGLLSLQVGSVSLPLCFPQEQQGSCGKLCHHHPTQQLLWQTTHA